jgi:hypothetical protein
MTSTLPLKPSPISASAVHDAPWRTFLDDAGDPVQIRTYELFKHPTEDDYDFEERAAIARAEGPLVLVRQRAIKLLTWLSLLWAIVGYVTLVMVATAYEYDSRTLVGLLPLIGVSIAFAIVLVHRRSVPAQTISDRVSAGLCGRCARRLNAAPNNMGLIRCRPCHLYWRASRITSRSPDALADRRKRSHRACMTKDARGVVAPLAAAYDGPWPTSSLSLGTTHPHERARWAKMLGRQRTMGQILVLFIVAWLAVSALSFAFLTSLGILLALLGIAMGATVGLIEAFIVTSPKRPSAWIRRSMHASTNHWLRQWRCPCCDAEFDTMGRWHLWGVASVFCERCHCVWQLHDLGKLTLKSANRCAKCDYDISGLHASEEDSARCPECGTMLLTAVILRCRACQMPLQFRTNDFAHALRCLSCGESNDVRWSIPGSIRPEVACESSATPQIASRTADAVRTEPP